MPLVSEVAALIKELGEVVESTRKIVEAVNDGRKFLKQRYPSAEKNLGDLLFQMQKAIEGLAAVTKVIGAFRFVVSGDTVDPETASRDLARFNDYVIQQREDVATLKGRIRDLKANCEKVRALRDQLDKRTESGSWGSMFELFGGKVKQRSMELSSALSNFYADDQRMIGLLEQTLRLAEAGLQEVLDCIGPAGVANPYNVPTAATILGSYALLFQEPQHALHALADDLSAARSALT
jgi:methyl-accepting chemotaxis protein